MHDSVMFPFVYLISLRHNIRWLEVALFPCHILRFAVYYVYMYCIKGLQSVQNIDVSYPNQ